MKLLGISGSPIKNSNLDRLIRIILDASGLESDFVKLSRFHIRPCLACLKCAGTNRCVQKDLWPRIETKMLEAQALVVGGYTTYNTLDAWTKTLFERMFSFRHRKNILKGKVGVAVGMGYKCEELGYEGPPTGEVGAKYIQAVLEGFGIQVIGSVAARGNPPCLSCGYGETCDYSNVIRIWGKDARVTEDKYNRIEDQHDVVAQAAVLGKQLQAFLKRDAGHENETSGDIMGEGTK